MDNPVLFGEFNGAEDDLTVYTDTMGEFVYKNRLVGWTRRGFLYVDKKVPKKGYYEFYPKLVEPTDIVRVTISRHIAILGFLVGLLLYTIGGLAFYAGWIARTHGGTGIVVWPLLGFLGGTLLVLGVVRNKIKVVSRHGVLTWISDPMNYQKTLSICIEATQYCRQQRLSCRSHVAGQVPAERADDR